MDGGYHCRAGPTALRYRGVGDSSRPKAVRFHLVDQPERGFPVVAARRDRRVVGDRVRLDARRLHLVEQREAAPRLACVTLCARRDGRREGENVRGDAVSPHLIEERERTLRLARLVQRRQRRAVAVHVGLHAPLVHLIKKRQRAPP
eukprot:5099397-Prymnesium_polylepis.1